METEINPVDAKKINANILTVPPLDMPKFRGLGTTFFHKMLEYKDDIAQTDAVTGEQQTYGLVLQKSIRTAIAMRSRGIKPNDVITICSYNHMDCLIPYYASFFLGAIPANLEPGVPLSDCVHLLKQVGPKMVFVASEAVKLMEDTLREEGLNTTIVVFEDTSNHIKFSEFLVPSDEEKDFVPFEVENLKDTATVVFSSGSTGLPKGICLTHYGLLGSIYQTIVKYPRGLVVLVFPNLYWIAGCVFTVFIVLHGFNRVIFRKFDVTKIWDLLKKNKVNLVSLNPHQVIGMCENGRPKDADTSNLRSVTISGGTISKNLILHIRKCLPGTTVLVSYGQTEQSGGSLAFSPEDVILSKEKPDCVGRPKPGYSYKVVDPETEEILGPNQEGELRIKTEYAMNGYYNLDSSEVWDSDGFMKTGDIVHYDEDHCFFVVDRIKDLMKYQMWHISPAKLEAIFYTHPAVQTCAVTSRTHPVDGDHLLGLVVLKESAVGKVTEEELQKYVDDRVGEQQKLRAGVKFVDSLPETVTGKLSRREIRRLVQLGKY